MSFTFLSIALTKFTFLDVLQVDSLAGLLEFLDHVFPLLHHFLVLLLLSRSSGGRHSRGLFVSDLLCLLLLFLFLLFLLLLFIVAATHCVELLLNILDAGEGERVLLQIFKLRDVVLEVEVGEVTGRVDLLEVDLLLEQSCLRFFPELLAKGDIW